MIDGPVSPEDGSFAAIDAITLFAEDLNASKDFYQRLFDAPAVFEDADSVVFKLGGTLINLLRVEAAPELVEPATVGLPNAGTRFVLTVHTDDVDAAVERLQQRGVQLLNGPVTRPWGPRTASVRDPNGHIWELAT
jgi:catechol 2,3-dioxygenase-like lactoylglutathione lyase family enzyme